MLKKGRDIYQKHVGINAEHQYKPTPREWVFDAMEEYAKCRLKGQQEEYLKRIDNLEKKNIVKLKIALRNQKHANNALVRTIDFWIKENKELKGLIQELFEYHPNTRGYDDVREEMLKRINKQ